MSYQDPPWEPLGRDRKYVELVLSMSADCLVGKGVSNRETFIGNLKMVIEGMETFKSRPEDADNVEHR